ncbi:MAG: PAS domain-containing protein [Rickettsiales bacterium]|nr:PAS domain-containing protein [Rickettsiales bacterium]
MDNASLERRITLRLLSYWEKQRRGRDMPTEQDIDPQDVRDLWPNCFIVHVEDLGKADYQYSFLGEAIARAYQGNLLDGSTTLVGTPYADRLNACYSEVIINRKPLIDEGEFRNIHQETIKYRQCLLPLGDEDGVTAIFGGMRYKIFSTNKV